MISGGIYSVDGTCRINGGIRYNFRYINVSEEDVTERTPGFAPVHHLRPTNEIVGPSTFNNYQLNKKKLI